MKALFGFLLWFAVRFMIVCLGMAAMFLIFFLLTQHMDAETLFGQLVMLGINLLGLLLAGFMFVKLSALCKAAYDGFRAGLKGEQTSD